MGSSTVRPAWVAGAPSLPGRTLAVHSPETGDLLAAVARPGPEEVLQAIAAAHAGRRELADEPAFRRSGRLRGLAAALEARAGEFAATIADEAGKPLRYARGEVQRAVRTLSLAAEEATRLNGELLPLDGAPQGENRLGLVRRVPAGVCVFITPFNFPLNLVAHKLGPALAAGCPFVLKPAEKTPLSALLLAELLAAADPPLPPGSWSVLPALPEDCEALAGDPRVRRLSFTGSAKVGWELKQRAAHARVLLELGGNAAAILDRDWDLEHALDRCAEGAFAFSGQVCISLQRMLVPAELLDAAVRGMARRAASLRRGPVREPETAIGPMITAAAADRVEDWIRAARETGAVVHAGGGRDGAFVEPTVLTGVPPEQPLWCEEVFGPVVVLQPYEDFEDALAQADASRYGLQAALFSHDWRHIEQAWRSLEVGQVIVGDSPVFRVDDMPYGGVKASGCGREGLRYAIEALTEPRLLVL